MASNILQKTNYDLEITRLAQLTPHPRQKEPKLVLEIYLGSVKFQIENLSFREQKEISISKRLEGELYFGTRIEFWVREQKSREVLAYSLVNYEELFNENPEERTVSLSLGENSFFQVAFVVNFSKEEIKEISQEEIEREQALKEEEERLERERLEREELLRIQQEEADRLARLEEEAKKKPKTHPVTLTNKYQSNNPYY